MRRNEYLLATSSVEHRDALEAWAFDHSLAVSSSMDRYPDQLAPIAAVVATKDLRGDQLRHLVLGACVVVVQQEHPSDIRWILEAGADPVPRGASSDELVLWLESRLRARRIPIGRLRFTPAICTLDCDGTRVTLQKSQARLLLALCTRRGPVSQSELHSAMGSSSYNGGCVRTHVYHLRRIVSELDPTDSVKIRSVRPGNYVLEVRNC